MKRHTTRFAAAAGAAAALAMIAAAPASADETADETPEMTEGEERLAKLLEGRVAGEPRSCIPMRLNERFRAIDKTAYVYGSGNTIYVQRTRNPEDIDEDDILVTRRFAASQVCKLDQMNTIDRFAGFFTGVAFFDDFVPYTRVKDDS